MSQKLLAKDKRRWGKRKVVSVALAVGGGLALAGLGYYLYRKLWVDRPPAPGATKDWSGCFDPPDWVNPKPAFSCGQKVADSLQNEAGYVDARTWTPSGSTEGGGYLYGTWTYSILGTGNVHEEANLTAQ